MKPNQTEVRTESNGLSRRDLLRRSAVGGATLAGVSAGAIRLDAGPVQESEAIAPIAAVGAVAAGTSVGLNVGWALREVDPLGINAPDQSDTADALINDAIGTATARKSTNASTIIDNKTIVEGIDSNAHAEGKLAAIEKINEQESQEKVEEAAHEAVEESLTTPLKNLIKSWNESVDEFETTYQMLADYDETSTGDVFNYEFSQTFSFPDSKTIELPNGEEIDERIIDLDEGGNSGWIRDAEWGVIHRNDNSDNPDGDPQFFVPFREYPEQDPDDATRYLEYDKWNDIYTDISNLKSEVKEGLTKYVDEVYGEVQAGELDTNDLLTPREQAELTSEDEDFPQAMADLQALNVGVDLEREAEIYLPDVEATVWGQLGYSGSYELQTGEVNPDNKDGAIYLTYDISQGQGQWSAYEQGIDGGELTFTAQPFPETIYYVDTVAGETVGLTAEDFDETDDGEWTVDLSDDLDNAITEVDQIEYYAETEETQYETIPLQDEFEIITFSDSDGEEYESAEFESSEPHTDDNYITEEEWQEQQERNEELIEQYEDTQGAGILPDFDNMGDIPAEYIAAAAAVVGGAALFGNSG